MPTPRALTVAALVGLLAATGCGTSRHSASTAPADPAAAKAAITADWQAFFDANTPRARSTALLQDGASLTAAISAAARLAAQDHLEESAKVTAVTFLSPTTAKVRYRLLANGAVLLPDATGESVLVGGRWLVAKETFCALVALGAPDRMIPGC